MDQCTALAEALRAPSLQRGNVATWQGAVEVILRVERKGRGKTLVERDYARIELMKWNGAGVNVVLYDGPIDDPKAAKLYPGIKSWRAAR